MRFNLQPKLVVSTMLIVFGSFCFAGLSRAAEPNPPEGFRALFNGQNMDGWYGYNPHQTASVPAEEREKAIEARQEEFLAHWRVENGELVILDYKTDRGITLEQLAERYAGQLAVYRRALAACIGMTVKETLLYSFEAGLSITV